VFRLGLFPFFLCDGVFQREFLLRRRIFLPAHQLRLRRGSSTVGHGREEAEENAIEQGVGAEVEDEEAEASGRSDGSGDSAEERQQPDLNRHQRYNAALFERRGRELRPPSSDR